MKLLLLLVAVFVLLWLLRGTLSGLRGGRADPTKRDPARGAEPPGGPQAMLQCAECGLHLPKGEALPGKGGVFCSDAHRAVHESRLERRDGAG